MMDVNAHGMLNIVELAMSLIYIYQNISYKCKKLYIMKIFFVVLFPFIGSY